MKNTLGIAGWLAALFAAGGIGSRWMPGEWYAALAKPAWNPPNWIFGPVWTVLYALMSVSAWLVWRQAGFGGAGAALGLFGLHRIDWALADILALWAVILAVLVLFWRAQPVPGALLRPDLAWVSFAAVLNFALWRLNRGLP